MLLMELYLHGLVRAYIAPRTLARRPAQAARSMTAKFNALNAFQNDPESYAGDRGRRLSSPGGSARSRGRSNL